MTPSANTQRIFSLYQTPALSLDVDAFLLDCRARNLAAGTLDFYEQKLRPLVTFLDGLNIQDAEAVRPTHLRTWFVHLQESSHNAGGVHAYHRATKAFFRWMHAEEMIDKNPMQRIRPPRVPLVPLEPVTVEQVRALLAACDPKVGMGCRDRAVLLCLWDSGCRASELTSLNVGDLDIQSGALLVRQGKGRKHRMTFLGSKTRREVLRYLRQRGDPEPGEPLFMTKQHGRLSYQGLRDILRRRAAKAGVEGVSLHSFRRGFAIESLRNGADVYSLQRMMGHTSLAVLRRYLRQTQDDLQQVHARSGPVDHVL